MRWRAQRAPRARRQLAFLAAVLPLACLAAAPPRVGDEPTAPSPEAMATAESERLAEALRGALEGAAGRRGLRLFAERYAGGARSAVEVFGNGLGIWNGERQFHASVAEIEAAVRAVLDAGFPHMAPTYGGSAGRNRRGGQPAEAGPVRILCAVEIEAGDVTQRVQQLAGGEEHGPLVGLADRLLSQWRSAGETGTRAPGLDEGLAAIAAGELAPETLRLTLHEKPEAGDPGSGVLLLMRGRAVTLRPFDTASGYGPPRQMELDEQELRELAGRIAHGSPGRLPPNLFADAYVDLALEVLGHRVAIQARRFAGMTATTHGERQRDFDRLLEAVRAVGASGD